MAVGFLKFFFFFLIRDESFIIRWGRIGGGGYRVHFRVTKSFMTPPPPPHTHTPQVSPDIFRPPPPIPNRWRKSWWPPPPNTHTHTHLLAATYTHMPFYTPVFDGSYYVVPSVLGTNINHHQTMCKERRTDTSLTFLRSYGPLKIFLWKSCPLYNFDTNMNIFMKLCTNTNKHQSMCREKEP